jgi:23S rRNA (cytidine1920-2'-O)/16S rRNA (cytidine1409-2'-O)-methyltransferase
MASHSSAGSPKRRLDLLLAERGLAETRERARALIMAGSVSVNGRTQTKPGTMVPADSAVDVAEAMPYVSRGGLKLAHALDTFGIVVAGLVCLDVGASTGGFTDVLLQRGAVRVFAVDVGYGQLHWRLRNDPRVVLMERTNARFLESLPERPDLATIDVSFISLKLVLPRVRQLLKDDGAVVALVKPQFEAGRAQVNRGGVVRDPAVHRQVLLEAGRHAREAGFSALGLTASPVLGPAGNREFLLYLGPDESEAPPLHALVESALQSGDIARG